MKEFKIQKKEAKKEADSLLLTWKKIHNYDHQVKALRNNLLKQLTSIKLEKFYQEGFHLIVQGFGFFFFNIGKLINLLNFSLQKFFSNFSIYSKLSVHLQKSLKN